MSFEWAPDTYPGNRQHSRYDYQPPPAQPHAESEPPSQCTWIGPDVVADLWHDYYVLREELRRKEVMPNN